MSKLLFLFLAFTSLAFATEKYPGACSVKYWVDGIFDGKTRMSYNDKNQLVELFSTSIKSRYKEHKIIFTYDSLGRSAREQHVFDSGSARISTNYEYFATGTSITHVTSVGPYTSTSNNHFDNNGNIQSSSTYTTYAGITKEPTFYTWKYEFKDKKKIQATQFVLLPSQKLSQIYSVEIFQYDDQGRLRASQNQFYSLDQPIKKTSSRKTYFDEYNSLGQLTKQHTEWIDADGSLKSQSERTWKYDDAGNVLESLHIEKTFSGEESTKQERRNEYNYDCWK